MRRSLLLATAAAGAVAIYAKMRRSAVDESVETGVAEWAPLVPAATTQSVPTTATSAAITPEVGASIEASDGQCPDHYPIKAKDSSMIYHSPGGRNYDRTNADRCFSCGEDAELAGFRPPKS
jgi:hypothetical protein